MSRSETESTRTEAVSREGSEPSSPLRDCWFSDLLSLLAELSLDQECWMLGGDRWGLAALGDGRSEVVGI